MNTTPIAIIGTGGFAKEVYNSLLQTCHTLNLPVPEVNFVVNDIFFSDEEFCDNRVFKLSMYDFTGKQVLIAVADPQKRSEIVSGLGDVNYMTLIHPSAIIGRNVKIGKGAIIMQQVVITCDIVIGDHCHLNLNTTIGHDCIIGDLFTSAPAVNISGNCTIGNLVYFGTQAMTKEKISVSDRVIIGMASAVIKPVTEPGTYFGVPATRQS